MLCTDLDNRFVLRGHFGWTLPNCYVPPDSGAGLGLGGEPLDQIIRGLGVFDRVSAPDVARWIECIESLKPDAFSRRDVEYFGCKPVHGWPMPINEFAHIGVGKGCCREHRSEAEL